MTKTHVLKTVIINHVAINYFYVREKNDVNGNARFRVYIMDPDAPVIYETIIKCYEREIAARVAVFVEEAQK